LVVFAIVEVAEFNPRFLQAKVSAINHFLKRGWEYWLATSHWGSLYR